MSSGLVTALDTIDQIGNKTHVYCHVIHFCSLRNGQKESQHNYDSSQFLAGCNMLKQTHEIFSQELEEICSIPN